MEEQTLHNTAIYLCAQETNETSSMLFLTAPQLFTVLIVVGPIIILLLLFLGVCFAVQ